MIFFNTKLWFKYSRSLTALLLVTCFSVIALPTHADSAPPEIIHDIITSEVAASQPFEFSATVTDEGTVEEVLLNFKHQDSAEFKSVPMTAKSGSPDYTVTLSAADLVAPGLDYFISATDGVGNIQFRGFDFDPLQLTIFAPVSVQTNTEEKTSSLGSRKIWYVVGAVALVGLAASAGGGSSSSGSGSAPASTPVFELVR